MHMQIAIEFGSDALDGDVVRAVARTAIDTVAVAIGHDVPAGDMNIEVAGTVYPVNVKFAKSLRGPGEETIFQKLAPKTFLPPITKAAEYPTREQTPQGADFEQQSER